MVKGTILKTCLVAVCFLAGTGLALGHRCQRPNDFDYALRLIPSWSDNFPGRNSLIHPFRNSFGFRSVFDDEFVQDPWFRHDLFCPWEGKRGCSLNDESTNNQHEDISQWVQNQKEKWEKDYQQRKQAWEEDEHRAKEDYFSQLDNTKAIHSQKEEPINQHEDQSNEVSIEIIGSISNENPNELLTMKILGYDKDDISVKTEGRKIHIQGKHSSGDCNEGSCISKEFRKTFVLPKEVEVSSVKAKFDDNGILRIEKNNNDKGTLEQNNDDHSNNLEPSEQPRGVRNSESHIKTGHEDSLKHKDVDVNNVGDRYHDDDVTIEVTDHE